MPSSNSPSHVPIQESNANLVCRMLFGWLLLNVASDVMPSVLSNWYAYCGKSSCSVHLTSQRSLYTVCYISIPVPSINNAQSLFSQGEVLVPKQDM